LDVFIKFGQWPRGNDRKTDGDPGRPASRSGSRTSRSDAEFDALAADRARLSGARLGRALRSHLGQKGPVQRVVVKQPFVRPVGDEPPLIDQKNPVREPDGLGAVGRGHNIKGLASDGVPACSANLPAKAQGRGWSRDARS